MLMHKDSFHGSDLEKIEKIYGIKKEDIVSFSANVNPLGLSKKVEEEVATHLDVICTYPDREYTALRSAIAGYCDSKTENILVGNGSTELITLFIKTISPKKALLISPTYSEYERELSLGGGKSEYYRLSEADDFRLDPDDLVATLDASVDMMILCNPNNPTSTAVCRDDMRRILDRCRETGTFVMIDETYVEFADDISTVSCVSLTEEYDNLCLLRGVSKFFAAPGLRLGYAVCGNHELLDKIAVIKDPWTVGSVTEFAGTVMFSDREYIEATRALISSERRRVTDALRAIGGLKVYEPAANFVLSCIEKENVDADILFDTAIRRNMMIRNCSTFPYLDNKFFRICFMSPSDNDKLLDVIREVLA